MTETYNTSVCLSHIINDDGSLTEQSRRRTEESYREFIEEEVETITLSGGYKNRRAPYTFAKAMEIYLLGKGINRERIFLEERSLDTVGQAIFTKTDVIIPHGWERLIVISDDDHLPRVKQIFDFVYGREFHIKYVGTGFKMEEDEITTRENEMELLRAFHRTFRNVEPARDEDILTRLFEKHPLYKASGGI